MAPPTAVLLIPGFFGYASFGPDEHPILEYFAGVRAILQPLLGEHFIATHEPPPTGSLQSRAKSLHDAVGKLLRGDLLPHGRTKFKAERIHLVGHSTGGVDARLFANPAYPLQGTTNDERKTAIAALGNIVSLSAPFYGTPLATKIEPEDRLLLEGVRVLTMLGIFTHGDLVRIGLELAKSTPAALIEHPLAVPLAALTGLRPRHFLEKLAPLLLGKAGGPDPHAPVLLLDAAQKSQPPSVSGLVAKQVSEFFHEVETDQALLGDLTVGSIASTNLTLARSDYGVSRTDRGRFLSYVSVAPPPPRFPLLDLEALRKLELLQSYIYATLYAAAASEKMMQARPEGPAIEPFATSLLDDPLAGDGVVPVRSQTLHGEATGIVLGDHLDVVGSFDGGSGANVMRSGSNFTGERFEKLWRGIAGYLA